MLFGAWQATLASGSVASQAISFCCLVHGLLYRLVS